MPVTHEVKQGECMSAIADQYGFLWSTLWNHEKNAELKSLRKNPSVLFPGDKVFIPDKREKEVSAQTGKSHKYVMKNRPVRFKIRLFDVLGNARADLDYTLDVDGEKFSGKTDADGLLSHVVPPGAKRGRLQLLQSGEEHVIELGHMDPVDQTTGLQGRLRNLGYYAGDISGAMDDATREAVRRFQMARGLPVTGSPDQQTRDALVAAHDS
jgi:hypothetical protein